MLSRDFEGAYDDLLAHLGRNCQRLPELLCCHWPTYLPAYRGDLLVLGQALNGWIVEAAPCDWLTAEARRATLVEARRYGESPNAFTWMSKRVRSRPFWRLVDLGLV